MTTTERALTASETGFLLAGFGPVVVRTAFTGRFETDVLERAWQRLGHEYPLLRCGILGSPDGFRLRLRDSMPTVKGGAGTFGDDIARRLEDGAISRLSLHETADATVLTLAVDHAVSDGRLVRNLLHSLLGIYTALLRGEAPPSAPRPVFEPGLEELFAGRYERGWPEPPSVRGQPLTVTDGPGAPSSGFGVHLLELEPGPTADIVAFARENGISVTGLLCGAVSGAVRAKSPEADGPLPVTLCVPVDFRERLVPPLDADAQLCGALPCTVTVPVAADDEPLKVGLRVTTELRAALDRDEPQRALLAQCHAPAPPPPMTIMVSSIGAIRDPVLPEGLRVTGSRFAATLNGPVPGMFVSTMSGRLTIDVVYDRAFHHPAAIGEFVASVETILRSR
ncbi:phthiocerol/phthiodiolone dimycocerosyl transferase family protein [Amycolatopsis regifaucium]|uniref:Phthiocerol/phthiodiolone dimycocerosyl transferase n=1 Tax=Amycolatopsis regifaucium TaxID=546365 RepID=A0A154MQF9_9PSEU|nr:chromosome condensation protein [Amycolatopsis regifaucium]KZB86516.1 chromosome condensation protein [Amycolatopsis regifaucium]OKA03460.1 chromosome condensation protein [Amycolatopsis regifaucium]SFJ13595.1 Phthiocerol/phthiodiolone dimycocerosyl transferase C-terminus [Amycolatopsis regifaucium]